MHAIRPAAMTAWRINLDQAKLPERDYDHTGSIVRGIAYPARIDKAYASRRPWDLRSCYYHANIPTKGTGPSTSAASHYKCVFDASRCLDDEFRDSRPNDMFSAIRIRPHHILDALWVIASRSASSDRQQQLWAGY
jgi:hypothetical protein